MCRKHGKYLHDVSNFLNTPFLLKGSQGCLPSRVMKEIPQNNLTFERTAHFEVHSSHWAIIFCIVTFFPALGWFIEKKNSSKLNVKKYSTGKSTTWSEIFCTKDSSVINIIRKLYLIFSLQKKKKFPCIIDKRKLWQQCFKFYQNNLPGSSKIYFIYNLFILFIFI